MEKTFGVSQFIPPPSPAPDSKSFLTLYFSSSSCTVFTVFTQPRLSPLGNDAGGSVQFLLSKERYCFCPQLTFVNFFVGGLSGEAEGELAVSLLPGDGALLDRKVHIVYGNVGEGERARVQCSHC